MPQQIKSTSQSKESDNQASYATHDDIGELTGELQFDLAIKRDTWEAVQERGYSEIFFEELDEMVNKVNKRCRNLKLNDIPIRESLLKGSFRIDALADFDSPEIPSEFSWDCFQLGENYLIRVLATDQE